MANSEPGMSFQEAFISLFSLFDVLFIGLAVYSAYRIAGGAAA